MKDNETVIMEDLIFDEMVDGNLINYFHISTQCDDDLVFYHAFESFIMATDDEDIYIHIKFDIEDVLKSMIDGKECGTNTKKMDAEDKPSFDELRRKCQAMIDGIDSLEFEA